MTRLPDSYACGDLQWQQDRYLKARKQLVGADLIHFDEENHVVMICRWFKHNPPMNEKHLIGIECILERLTSTSIREAALGELNKAMESSEAERVVKAQRKLKPIQGPVDSLQGAMPERLQTPFMAKRR